MVFAYGKFTPKPMEGMLVWSLSDGGREVIHVDHIPRVE
jgi:hypothetical protein